MQKPLTVPRLGVRGRLKRTLASTNACESMIETVRRTSRNVKRWQNGDMCLRWTAAGMLEAERQFRKIIGHTDLAKLAVAIERDIAAKRADGAPAAPAYTPITTAAPEVAASPPKIIHSQDRRREVPRRAGHPRRSRSDARATGHCGPFRRGCRISRDAVRAVQFTAKDPLDPPRLGRP